MDIFHILDKLKSEFDKFLPLDQEVKEKLQKKIRLEFNYNSNHLEGNTLTYGETQLLLIHGKVSGDFDIRELDEMKAHDVAYSKIIQWANNKERDITETDIKTLNELILVRPFWKEALTSDGQATRRLIKVGDYKEHPNSVKLQNGELFHYASVLDTPVKMQELMSWYNKQKTVLHPVQLAAEFHHKFVLIHPFDDGNGRISRLLVNYILLRNGFPPIVVKSSDKKNYLLSLNKADAGDMDAFTTYMSKQLTWSLELYIAAAKGEEIEEVDDWKKKLNIIKKDDYTIQRRTAENTYKFLSTTYSKLIKDIESELKNLLDNIFLDIYILHKLPKQSYFTIDITSDLDKKAEDWLQRRRIGDLRNSKVIQTTFNFIEYAKNGLDSFNIQIVCILILEKHGYIIRIESPDPIIRQSIEEPISESQTIKISNRMGSLLVEKIEIKLKQLAQS